MTELRYLLYASTAVRDYSEMELLDLLTSSRRFNERSDITGLLLYSGPSGGEKGTFVQVLEGPGEAVTSLYRLIVRDSRHEHCTLMQEGSLLHRRFPDWSMGFRHLSQEPLPAVPGFSTLFSQPWTIKEILTHPDPVLQTMLSFAGA